MRGKALLWIVGIELGSLALLAAAAKRGVALPPGLLPEGWEGLPDARARIVAVAQGEVGPQDSAKYWAGVLPAGYQGAYPPDWCGGFALWVLKQAGLAPGLVWEVGRGFCYKLPQTTVPMPGDIAFFQTNQHQAVIIAVDATTVTTVDGNQRGKVAIRKRPLASVTAFYSVAPLIAGSV